MSNFAIGLIGHEQFGNQPARLFGPVGCGPYDHALSWRSDARSCQRPFTFDFNHARAAVSVGSVAGLVGMAEMRDQRALTLGHIPDGLTGFGGDGNVIENELGVRHGVPAILCRSVRFRESPTTNCQRGAIRMYRSHALGKHGYPAPSCRGASIERPVDETRRCFRISNNVSDGFHGNVQPVSILLIVQPAILRPSTKTTWSSELSFSPIRYRSVSKVQMCVNLLPFSSASSCQCLRIDGKGHEIPAFLAHVRTCGSVSIVVPAATAVLARNVVQACHSGSVLRHGPTPTFTDRRTSVWPTRWKPSMAVEGGRKRSENRCPDLQKGNFGHSLSVKSAASTITIQPGQKSQLGTSLNTSHPAITPKGTETEKNGVSTMASA